MHLGPVQTSLFHRAKLNCNLVRLQYSRKTTLTRMSCQSRTKFRSYWSHATISQRWWNKNNGAVFEIAAKTSAYKIIARLEKKTERKPAENTSPFVSKANAVIASLFPNHTPVFFRKLHCCSIVSTTTTTQLRMVWTFMAYVQWCQVQEDIPCV